MLASRIICLLLCFAIGQQAFGQSGDISFSYHNQPLHQVLKDLELKYKLRFSYAQQNLSLHRRITLKIHAEPIDKALEKLFVQHAISFANIGGQWVLKNAKQAPKSQKIKPKVYRNQQPVEKSVAGTTKVPKNPQQQIVEKSPRQLSDKGIQPIRVSSISNHKTASPEASKVQALRGDVKAILNSWQERKATGSLKVFQFSALGTSPEASQKTNILAFSLAWGLHGALEGVQTSVFGSAIRNNASGLQLAGIFNGVGGHVMGLQAAGLSNSVRGNLMGLQISGLFNRSQQTMGGQISLGLNWAEGRLIGLQLAGLGNVARQSANSAQIASVFNLTAGKSNFQASGIYNKAHTVQGAQISLGTNEAEEVEGLQLAPVNRAKKVNGLQFGIINMADTVKGVSFGLLNIIQEGAFNKLELGCSESMHVLMSLKMGPKSLYHIYQGGFTLMGRSWGIGGGFGSVIPLQKPWSLNIEGTLMHINETKKWTPTLNLQSQISTSFEYTRNNGFGVFIGPSLNFICSRYRNPETGNLGSDLPAYSLWEHNTAKTNYRAWIGFYAGIRMTLW